MATVSLSKKDMRHLLKIYDWTVSEGWLLRCDKKQSNRVRLELCKSLRLKSFIGNGTTREAIGRWKRKSIKEFMEA